MTQAIHWIARLFQTIFSWATDEDGLTELLKRKRLANAKKECTRALENRDFDTLRHKIAELERLSNQP